ncbi:UNVERIFIED_CONTAM: hypothetical protein Scaly_0334000 [Sesamum calycinum]|uniref:Uncharacterized protein n=1 Tax=Sesamum calycinum TaxID=2727403 RepID=A0AAW2SBK3_9LAMI
MRVSEQSQWQLLRRQYLGEISALCFLRLPAYLCSLPLLLAGTGSQILVYDLVSGKIIRSFPVFEGIRVHGISVEHFHKPLPGSALAFRIAVFGERRVKLLVCKLNQIAYRNLFWILLFGKWFIRIITSLRSNAEDHIPLTSNEDLIPGSKYKDALISRLVGHEGSIFRIAWFSNGMKLVSVSDDRSARIWEVQAEKGECKDRVNHLAGPVLFGHTARIWDCCIYDSTGADGCICYLQHNMLNLEFIGMKQVKELSAIRSVFTTTDHTDDSAVGNYAVGFASANFIIWNLTTGTKVLDITCGGWRRPHSYYLGDLPEMMNCFSFVKDNEIRDGCPYSLVT